MFYDIHLHHTIKQAVQHRSESEAGTAFTPLFPLRLLSGSTANAITMLARGPVPTAALVPAG